MRVARFTSTEVSEETKLWQFALVGSVFGMIPRFSLIESFALNRWKSLGLEAVHLVKENVFVFKFRSNEAKLAALSGSPYTFDRRPLLLKEWTPFMKMDVCDVQKLPIWIQFPLLPWELWKCAWGSIV